MKKAERRTEKKDSKPAIRLKEAFRAWDASEPSDEANESTALLDDERELIEAFHAWEENLRLQLKENAQR